jgi:hypothetical protein
MEAVYQVVEVIAHNSIYAILGIVGLLVITAFTIIFIKSHKEYRETMSSTYYAEKKNSNINIADMKPSPQNSMVQNAQTQTSDSPKTHTPDAQPQTDLKNAKNKVGEDKPAMHRNEKMHHDNIVKLKNVDNRVGHNTYIQDMIKEIEKEMKKSA